MVKAQTSGGEKRKKTPRNNKRKMDFFILGKLVLGDDECPSTAEIVSVK